MPEFISRLVEWFQARSTIQKALIVIGVLVLLVLLVALSQLAVLIATVVLLGSLVALVLRVIRRGPLQGPAIVIGVSLVAILLFGAISSGGDQPQDTTAVQEVTEEPVADPEPEQEREAEPVEEPEAEPIVIPDSVDYEVVGQTGDDDRGFSMRTWEIETEDDSPGALCAIGQDAALDPGAEGFDVVRVVSDAGDAYARMSDAAPDYSDTEGFEECPLPGDIFITR